MDVRVSTAGPGKVILLVVGRSIDLDISSVTHDTLLRSVDRPKPRPKEH